MRHLFIAAAVMLSMLTIAAAQTTDNPRLICKGTATPEGYVIIGEGTSKDCPNQAWVIKKRGSQVPAAAGPSSLRESEGPAESSGEWQSLSPDGEEFSVLMPGEAAHRTSTTMAGDIEAYELKTDAAHFMLLSKTVNLGSDTVSFREAILKGFIVGYKSSFVEELRKEGIEADLVFDRDLRLGEFPAKHYRVVLNKADGFVRFVATNDHLYVIQVLTLSQDGAAAATKFLNSFKLVKR